MMIHAMPIALPRHVCSRSARAHMRAILRRAAERALRERCAAMPMRSVLCLMLRAPRKYVHAIREAPRERA